MARPDNASVFQVSQIGVETTPGTAVPALKRLHGLSFEIAPEGDIKMFAPQGYKFNTLAIPGKEWAGAKLSVASDYQSLAYVLDGVLMKTTPTGAGGAKTRAYTVKTNQADTIQTYTLEHGSSLRGKRTAYNLITDFGLSASRDEVKLDGSALSRIITDPAYMSTCDVQSLAITGSPTGGNFTLTYATVTSGPITYNATASNVQTALEATSSIGSGNVVCTGGPLPANPVVITFVGALAQQTITVLTATSTLTGGTSPSTTVTSVTVGVTPTDVPAIPITPNGLDLYIDPTAAALGTTKILRGFNLDWKIGSRFAPIWCMNSTNTSWVSHVESMPKSEFSITLECDDEGMSYVTNQRAGTTLFIRLVSTGPAISGGGNYGFTLDFACKISKPYQYTDASGAVYAVQYGGELVHDSTWGKALSLTLVNTLATL